MHQAEQRMRRTSGPHVEFTPYPGRALCDSITDCGKTARWMIRFGCEMVYRCDDCAARVADWHGRKLPEGKDA